MSPPLLPLIVLGGRDRRSSTLPEAGQDKHQLRGYKGIDLKIGGRPLITLVCERLQASGAFAPLYVAGPRALYEGVVEAVSTIDTDGDFGQNIGAALAAVMTLHPGSPVAFTTCDVLPDQTDLAGLLADYRRHAPLDFWMPLIRVPEDPSRLGESQWKPRYRLVPEGETAAVEILPGHLIVVDPLALRRDLLYRLFELSYRTRNKSVEVRRLVIARKLLGSLIFEDLRRLARLRPPTFTWDVTVNGLAIAAGLRSGRMGANRLAHHVAGVYVRRLHRREHPGRQGRMPILDGLSLAKDIDTEEEAREMAKKLQLPEPEAPT